MQAVATEMLGDPIIDYKHVFVFDSSFEHIVRKLEILVESGEREKALEIEKYAILIAVKPWL